MASKTSTLTATTGHPFWVPELRMWLEADELKAGQWLQTSAGTWTQISAVHSRVATATVYNLTVDELHTYYALAGNTATLVHNCGRGSTDPADLPDFLDPDSGNYVRPRGPGAAADESGKTQKAAEEVAEEAENRRDKVGSAPTTVQKMVDGPQAPGAHGPAEAIVAAAIVVARGWQHARKWWRNQGTP
ncbi:polymorphic toxin-type HINT domain-containing protein [Streptomyces sp. NPDC019396]|uniref:polymorphic toxin-type HINT domain-containing protein n=1 Tax=Streptomyces sp. NPDC019396 TaxID=3154687 RepID=UPI0033E8F8CB